MGKDPNVKLNKLKEILKSMESVLIAFSGGVDSTFLLKVASQVLNENVLAVTARSETYPYHEFEEAKSLAKDMGVKHHIIETSELEIDGFKENPYNRCYYCKKELFSTLRDMATRQGIKEVLDGSNYDDTKDHRPGMDAAREIGVRSPLMEAQLTKDDIRVLSRDMGLPTWDKPSFACLSSRFPYGTPINKENLQMVSEAENILRQVGIKQLRVRHHGDIARIEVEKEDFPLIMEYADEISKKLEGLGYTYVTLDLAGYRTGSLNAKLKKQEYSSRRPDNK